MPPEMFFKDEAVLAMISEASVDFTPADFDSPLSLDQRAYIKKYGGVDVREVFWRKQVHGDAVLIARGKASAQGYPDADAYITDEKFLPIAIRTADCVPVFIFDGQKPAIGLAHAGWKGTYQSIALKTVLRMQEEYASKASDLKIVLGPSIRECCYQVGEEFRDYFPGHVKTRAGHLYLDVISANRDQLIQAGIRPENIFDSGLCTCCNKNYFSFRRDGQKAGRMISLMMLI
jgi:YfiH family protein